MIKTIKKSEWYILMAGIRKIEGKKSSEKNSGGIQIP